MNEELLFELAEHRYSQLKKWLKNIGISTSKWKVRVQIGTMSEFPDKRNVAYTSHLSKNKCLMVFAPKWKYLTDNNYDAVLQHELMHVLHMIRPDIFKLLEKQKLYFTEEECEIFSDMMAEEVFENTIHYDNRLIQTLAKTEIPLRPRHLGW